MSFDRTKTLEQLKGVTTEEPTFNSSLVKRVHELYRKPLLNFTVEDLRLMVGQGIELEYLLPLALEKLEADPFAAGDYYRGDLLMATLRIGHRSWEPHLELYARFCELISGLSGTLLDLHSAIENFLSERA